MSDDKKMTRSDAIREVIGYIDRIDSEWGPGGSTAREATEVLTALGVSRDELVAHNLIREGFYHDLVRELATIASATESDEVVLRRLRKRLAISQGTDPEGRATRARLVELVGADNWDWVS